MSRTIPDKYLDTYPIPPEIFQNWNRWEGANWRIMRYADKNNGAHPRDQRLTVSPPADMCLGHLSSWYQWRNTHYDYRTGYRWPGSPGSPFTVIGRDLKAVHEWRRWEWDEKTIEQMQMIEQFCADGRGCTR